LEPYDCSAALLADDRFVAAPDDCSEQVDSSAGGCSGLPDGCSVATTDAHSALVVRIRDSAEHSAPAGCSEPVDLAPDDCWVAVPDDHSVPEARTRDSVEDLAPAGYLVPADSSQADCSEPVDLAPDDCWVAVPDDHSVPEARIRDSAGHLIPAGYSAPALPVAHLLASLRAGFQADLRRVAASQAVKGPQHSLAVQRSQRRAEPSLPTAAVLQAVRDAAPAPAVSPRTTAAVAVALFWR